MSDDPKKAKSRPLIFLRGRQVVLTLLDRSRHFENIMAWFNDPEVRRFAQIPLPTTRAEQEKWFEWEPQKDIRLAIETKRGQHIGYIGLTTIDWASGTAETSTIIGERAYRSKGVGTDAKMTILEYAFNHLGLRKIFAGVFDHNGACKKYSRKCGYQREAVMKEYYLCDGQYYDLVWFSIHRRDWPAIFKAYQSGLKSINLNIGQQLIKEPQMAEIK